MPEYNTFINLQTELNEKVAQYDASSGYYNAVTKTYNSLQNHKADLVKIDNALPATPDVGGIIYFLGQTATSNGMTTQNLFLSTASAANAQVDSANKIKNLVFFMSVYGDYASLQRFINALEQSARLFEITSISFGSSIQAQNATSFSLQIATHSY